MKLARTGIILKPDSTRVFFRPFDLNNPERITRVIARVMSLSESAAEKEAQRMMRDFEDRHQRLAAFLLRRFDEMRELVFSDAPLSEARRLLIGGYFTQEYALEAAALFNPSIVLHPDQSNLPEGTVRFVLSLRATGEGHVSSIVFRSGTIDTTGRITIEKPTPFVTAAQMVPNPTYEKELFQRKLIELGLLNSFASSLMNQLDDSFSLQQLKRCLQHLLRRDRSVSPDAQETARNLLALANANYAIHFDPASQYSERVIFPTTPAESRGIEDARFVAFREEDNSITYYATYTAYDGRVILPQILQTRDFVHFQISTLNGPQVQNKGMALFPRKINGRFCMLSRQDNENIYIMSSDMLHFWNERDILLRPTYAWEFVQLGNCGSPIETSEGWLVLTHGVGPMRRYTIGAILLDLNEPSRVIARLPKPLMTPTSTEREGYVPNVVYSCGAMVHNGLLILPYAMSDESASFATVPLQELLDELKENPVT